MTDDGSDGSGAGNTRNRPSASKSWVLTLNNYSDEEYGSLKQVLENLGIISLVKKLENLELLTYKGMSNSKKNKDHSSVYPINVYTGKNAKAARKIT